MGVLYTGNPSRGLAPRPGRREKRHRNPDQKKNVNPSIPVTPFKPRLGSWRPAHDQWTYRASTLNATFSFRNQWVPVPAWSLNSNVPLKSGGPMLVAVTPAPTLTNGTQRVPVAKL